MTDSEAVGEPAQPPIAEGSPKRPKRRWRRRVLWSGLGILVVILLLVGAEVGYLAYENHSIHRVTVKHLAKEAAKGKTAGQVNILLLGSTSRCALKQQDTAFGLCSAGVDGVNSDVVMVLHLDPDHHRASILSLPRDLVLQNVRPGQFHKIDAGLADGPGQLVSVVEQDFGIPINHFVELNFDSFQGVVNALGGLHMYFPDPVKDTLASLNVPTAGCVDLNGFKALAVVRARHLSYEVDGTWDYDGSGDLGRIVRVHEFLRVLASAVSKRGLDNPITDNDLINAIAQQLTVDSSFGAGEMIHLVRVFHSINPNTTPETTLPIIEDTDVDGYSYEGINYGSVVFPTYPQDMTAVQQFLGLSAPQGTGVSPASVTVSLLNGTEGNSEAATSAATSLGALGYHVLGTGQATPVGQIAETIVYYAPGKQADAERVLQSLSGIASMTEGPTTKGADVTIVTGSDLQIAKPTAANSGTTTTSPHAHSGTTTATKGASGTGSSGAPSTTSAATTTVPPTTAVTATTQPSSLAPPTGANSALPPYDPRVQRDERTSRLSPTRDAMQPPPGPPATGSDRLALAER